MWGKRGQAGAQEWDSVYDGSLQPPDPGPSVLSNPPQVRGLREKRVCVLCLFWIYIYMYVSHKINPFNHLKNM